MFPQELQHEMMLRNHINDVIEQSTERENFVDPNSKTLRSERGAFAIFTYSDSNSVGNEGTLNGVSGGPNY